MLYIHIRSDVFGLLRRLVCVHRRFILLSLRMFIEMQKQLVKYLKLMIFLDVYNILITVCLQCKNKFAFMLCILKCYCRNWFYSCILSKFCEVNLSLSAWCLNWLVKYACKLCHIWKQMGNFFFQTNRNIYIYKIWKILKTLFWNFDFISSFLQIRSVEFLFVNWYVIYLQHFFKCTFLCKYF